jgi:hypothetical protein
VWPHATAIVTTDHAIDTGRFQDRFREISLELTDESADRNEVAGSSARMRVFCHRLSQNTPSERMYTARNQRAKCKFGIWVRKEKSKPKKRSSFRVKRSAPYTYRKSAVDEIHHMLGITLAGGGAVRSHLFDTAQIGFGKFHVQGANIFF